MQAVQKRFVVEILALALGAALLVVGGPATAQGADGLIAFENRHDEVNNLDRIEVMNPNGSGRRVVVDDAYDAALSPDGSEIAFVRDGDIWVADVASGAESLVSGAAASESQPTWAPDGSLLAFQRRSPAGADCSHLVNGDIVVIDFMGEVQVTDTDCLSEGRPDFSPDGTRLVFQSFYVNADFSGGLSFLTVADLATGSMTDITDPVGDRDAYNPSWSPDGSRIAFDDFVDVYSVPASGGTSTSVVTAPGDCTSLHPDWSPDGTQIAVTLQCADTSDIAVVAPGGGTLDPLTDGDGELSRPSWAGAGSPGPGPDPVEPEGVRLDGGGRADPVGQAIATSQALFEDGAADRVVLATAERFPDALAGSPLAGDDGPILLTPFADDLDPRVAAEIARVTGGDGVALILGGTAAVSEGAADQARAAAGSPSCGAAFPSDCRYAGSGREDTAAQIAATVLAEHGGDRALLARGDVFADAITGGAYAAQAGVPILLTPPDQLNGSTYAFIEGNGIDEVIILGGVAAVDQATMDVIPASDRRRIEGRDRTETAAAIATQLWVAEGLDGGGSLLVNVRDDSGWQTALTGAVLAAVFDIPQLGVENPPAAPTQATLDAADVLGGTVFTLGGTDLVSVEQRNAVQASAD